MVIQFKDRKKELKEIKKILESNRFELTVIYGKRRIGKTSLVLEATKSYKRIYFLATEENNLNRFYTLCMRHFPEIQRLKKDYETIFDFLKNKVEVIIIDEFQNIIKENKRTISLFQAIVDTILVKSKIKLFLLGSSISLMTSTLLSYKSPLYGRKTAAMKLSNVSLRDLKEFFPKRSFEELLTIYSFTGGIPFYATKIRGEFWKWLKEETKKETTFIRDEVDFLMHYEFEDVSTYKLILQAIAFGKTTIKEIKNFIGIKRTDLSPYLKNLILTEFIERRVPITENAKSRRGRYFLRDHFLKFWFRFIYPNLSLIEEGTFNIDIIKNEFSSYLGFVFEEAIIQLLKHLRFFNYTKIGRWWHKDKEIDIVALNEKSKEILFGECKWQSRVNALKTVKELAEKSKYVEWHNKERKESFAIFAKSFSKRINEYEGKRVYCFDLKEIEKAIKKH